MAVNSVAKTGNSLLAPVAGWMPRGLAIRRLAAERFFINLSDGSRTAQQARRQEEKRAKQPQHAAHSNPDDSKWKENQPHERVGDEREQRERPTQNKQDDPQQ